MIKMKSIYYCHTCDKVDGELKNSNFQSVLEFAHFDGKIMESLIQYLTQKLCRWFNMRTSSLGQIMKCAQHFLYNYHKL